MTREPESGRPPVDSWDNLLGGGWDDNRTNGHRTDPGGRTAGHHAARQRTRAGTITRIGLVVLVLAALAVGTSAWIRHRHNVADRRSQRTAERTADAYVAAMDGGAITRFENVLDQPADGENLISSFRDTLQIGSARYTHGPVVRHGAVATVPYSADLALTGLGHWRFTGTVTMRHHHRGGGWRSSPNCSTPTGTRGCTSRWLP